MSTPVSRRGFLCGLTTLPLIGGSVALTLVSTAAGAASPDLLHIIAEHDRTNDRLNAARNPDQALIAEAGALRARVVAHPSVSLADTFAKAGCIARMWPLLELEEEVREGVSSGFVCLDTMGLALLAEVARLAEGGR